MKQWAAGLIIAVGGLTSVGWVCKSHSGSGAVEPPARDAFAADRDNGFDGTRAIKYLESVCRIGPRISGTDGMKKQQELLKKHFETYADKVEWQHFSAKQKSQPRRVDMANLIVSWYPERKRRVILCTHYDTRPIADQEPDPRKWREPFLSANDGTSGVAFLMEMAPLVKKLKAEVGVDFVFFDGEEYIFNPAPAGDDYFFGSEYFARQYRQNPPNFRYVAAILLDMIGGKNAQFPVEENSLFHAGSLVQDLWQVATDQKVPAFQNLPGAAVRDDHIALNQVGIPAVDIIDFNYPHWHRLSDIPDNCSGVSLAQVAKVVMVWLQKVK